MKLNISIISWLLISLIGAVMIVVALYLDTWSIDTRLIMGLGGLGLIGITYYVVDRHDKQ